MSEHKVLYYVNFQKPHLMNQKPVPRDGNAFRTAFWCCVGMVTLWSVCFAVIWL
jgi:hypothetical protein